MGVVILKIVGWSFVSGLLGYVSQRLLIDSVMSQERASRGGVDG